ncbi:MAG: type II toxin-antitoxin system VapC family toxin [Gemmatimonadales bacterium]
MERHRSGEVPRGGKELLGLKRIPPDGPIALDTSVFIYFIEEHPRWIDIVDSILALASTDRELVTSELTLLECLVIPYRAGDQSLAERYEALLCRSRGLSLIPVDRANLRAAAQLRARYGLKTPDALQIAAALATGSSSFVTNDRRLPEIPGLRILQLRDLV